MPEKQEFPNHAPNNEDIDPYNKEQLTEYVRRAAESNTITEIAALWNISPYLVSQAAERAGVKCVKDIDRLKKLVLDNPDKTARQIAKKCYYTPERISQVAKLLRIELPKQIKVSHTGNLHEWHRQNDPQLQKFNISRVKDVYTQSSSPYGIATELHGIKTK